MNLSKEKKAKWGSGQFPRWAAGCRFLWKTTSRVPYVVGANAGRPTSDDKAAQERWQQKGTGKIERYM